ncbi:MAG: hypothetical protein ABI243_12120, partial [Lapillicoccus sp.]
AAPAGGAVVAVGIDVAAPGVVLVDGGEIRLRPILAAAVFGAAGAAGRTLAVALGCVTSRVAVTTGGGGARTGAGRGAAVATAATEAVLGLAATA